MNSEFDIHGKPGELIPIRVSDVEAEIAHRNEFRKERLRQAKFTFNAALSLVVAGVLLGFGGVGLLLAGKITSGIASASMAGITEIISVIVFAFNREANNRLDRMAVDLANLEQLRTKMMLFGELKKRNLVKEYTAPSDSEGPPPEGNSG